jgi:hypothetical protein
MMDHTEALERLELAAVEPGGLDRLANAHDPEAAALFAHVRSCDECSAELESLRDSAPVISGAMKMTPSADLRDRTLAHVRDMGRPRQSRGEARDLSDAMKRHWWLPERWAAASLAAAILISVVATGWIVASRFDARLTEANAAISQQQSAIEGLAELSDWTLRLTADPNAVRYRLLPPAGDDSSGTVLYSPETGEMVMVATGLTPPSSGKDYRCWVELDGERQAIGKLFFAGDLGYWVGDVEEVVNASESVIGVTLVDISSEDLGGEVTLQGES